MSFVVNRQLLNPKFEGYKLLLLPQEEYITRQQIQSDLKPSQINASGRTKTPLSFEEVQSRIRHNHLTLDETGESAFYVDGELRVVRVNLDKSTSQPNFTIVYELAKLIYSPDLASTVHREYPSVTCLTGGIQLVSDGYGQIDVIRLEGDNATSLGVFILPSPAGNDALVPFKLHSASQTGDAILCVLSNRAFHAPELANERHHEVLFDLWLTKVPLNETGSTEPTHLQVLWHGKGNDIPLYSFFDSSRDSFAIVGGNRYVSGTTVHPNFDPTGGETVGLAHPTGDSPNAPEKPPPYSWTQTSDEVTVAFPVPSDVPKSAFRVTLTAMTLTILIHSNNSSPIPLPRYSLRKLWDGINPSTSFWTWDKEAEHKYGILTIHLDKQHEGTRWPHVFASSGTVGASETEDVEVPETLDPSELWHIRESLEKYTSALVEGEDASGLGLGRGVPKLAEGEIDDEIDSSIGRQVWVTWIGRDGSRPSWVKSNHDTPVRLLSTPLPSFNSAFSLVTKSGVDGLFFELPSSSSETGDVWEHQSTYSALAFVLASKIDTRFTFHVSSQAVFAFESGSVTGGGNMYIYRRPTGKEAKQTIMRVAGGESGALLGVVMLKNGAILGLCENDLVIVNKVL